GGRGRDYDIRPPSSRSPLARRRLPRGAALDRARRIGHSAVRARTLAPARARARGRPALSPSQPRAGCRARPRAPTGGRKALARVRVAARARWQRRDPGPARGRGADSYRSVRVLRRVRAGHHDRHAAGLVLARRAGTARLRARGEVGDGAAPGLGGRQRGRRVAARGKDTAVTTSRKGVTENRRATSSRLFVTVRCQVAVEMLSVSSAATTVAP